MPRVMDGQDFFPVVDALTEELSNSFKKIDLMDVGSGDAELISEIIDLRGAFVGLMGPVEKFLDHGDGMTRLQENIGKTGTSPIAVFGNAMHQTPFYSERMALLLDAAPTLAEVLPKLKDMTAILKAEKDMSAAGPP